MTRIRIGKGAITVESSNMNRIIKGHYGKLNTQILKSKGNEAITWRRYPSELMQRGKEYLNKYVSSKNIAAIIVKIYRIKKMKKHLSGGLCVVFNE